MRESAKVQRKKDKQEKRDDRKVQREARKKTAAPGEDPDIAGIEPGPQKLDPTLFGTGYGMDSTDEEPTPGSGSRDRPRPR